MTQTLLDEALALHAAGISVIPIHPHGPAGDKRPAVAWKQYQTERASHAQVEAWFTSGQYGIGVICGTISGDLLMVEIEAAAADRLTELGHTATDLGLTGLWQRVTTGWLEKTPSGGYHWYLYAPGNTSGNRKLARALDHKVLAETREQGGYSVVAPTPGAFHASGQAWTRLTGGPATAATLTSGELDDFLSIFRTLDQAPQQAALSHVPTTPRDPRDGITPGDDFENKTPWSEILTGWTPVQQRGTATMWRRPGKDHGISASTGAADDRDRLYVWTTSTEFEPETPYTKFGAYALLEHDGDHSAAAKHLADQGYGRQAEHPRDTTGLDTFIQRLSTQAAQAPSITVSAAVAVTPDEAAPVFTLDISEPDTYTRTDDGNALRFVDEYHTRVRWIPENSTWAAWNGYKWDSENGNAVSVELARNLARNLPTDEKADETHKRKSLSRSGVVNMLSLAQTDRRVYAPLPTFDADPFMLNTPAGPVDLRTGKTLSPDPSRRLLRATTTAPDPDMPTPRWDQFISQTFTNDRELIQYTQRLLGVALIGKVHQQILPFFHGAGANGKSTMLNVIQHILGIGEGGYTSTVPADIFLASAGNRHPADIASLAGTRIAVTSETEEGQRFAEARVKLLTGSDNISARFMHGNFFTFTPTHTFFLLSNHEPEVSSGGTAFWRRVRKLPFLNIVPEQDRDPHLETKLLEEGPGILAWMIQGTRDYLHRGMEEPEAVRVATKEYELDQDSIAQFVSDQCTTGDPNSPALQTLVSVFRDSYDRWCRANAMEPIHQNHIGGKLRRFGVETRKGSKGIRYYHGISISPEWDTSRSDDNDIESAWDDLGGGR